uniref:Surfactant protein C n=1 Tax=Salvator merianae TaxID=96440 RepID=A0A8D0C9Q7_SALMN
LPGVSCKKLLIVVVVVVVIVLVVLGFLLLGLHITEKHTEAVSAVGGYQLWLVCYEFPQKRYPGRARWTPPHLGKGTLLIGYRSWPGGSCYILRMSKENIQSLDAAIRVFQHIKEWPSVLLYKG